MWNDEVLRCDLHTHSCFSDGEQTPEQLVEAASALRLHAIALTDHNTTAGKERFLAAGAKYGVETVPGIELSTVYEACEVHIVGLFVSPAAAQKLADCVAYYKQLKWKSNRKCVERLIAAGYAIDMDETLGTNPTQSVNRVHIARALMEKGCVPSVNIAFKTLLNPEKGYYSPPEKIQSFDGIRMLRNLNVIPIFAHPCLSLNRKQMEPFLEGAASSGLMGIETRCTMNTPADDAFTDKLANRFGLLRSGGSDYHGINKPETRLGAGRGKLYVPAAYYNELLETSRRLSQ